MVQSMRNFTLLIFVGSLVVTLACSTATPTNTNSTPAAPAQAKKTNATGTITADPNPIKVCDKSGSGIAKLTWSASGTSTVEVRIGAPDGALFTNTSAGGGTAETGKWMGNGTVVYLQEGGKPLTAEYTIAKVTVNLTTEGCP